MIERIRKISNPLTIIAIFAALAEIAGTVALATVPRDLQSVFLWFVMLFPCLLLILFFATLNFNPKVLYAPSDFRDEKLFLYTLSGVASSEPQITITRDNVDEAPRAIAPNGITVEKSKAADVDYKRSLEAANAFFEALMDLCGGARLKSAKLERIDFSMHSPELFLLHFVIPKELMESERFAREFNFIIRIIARQDGSLSHELIGKGISDDDTASFARAVCGAIGKTIERQTTAKWPEGVTKRSSSAST
ncbi:MAG: hypothetical protein ACYTDW_16210 [Planctomycetota bacterium]